MKRFKTIIALSSIALAACSGSSEATPGGQAVPGEKGKLTITIDRLQDDEMAGGLLNACSISLAVDNRIGQDLNGVGFSFLADIDEDSIDAMTSGAFEEQTGYIGKVPKGAKVEDDVRIKGAACESVKGIKIVSVRCSYDAGNCPDDIGLLPEKWSII